jgi:two-component system cell cycle response regulator CtrA
MIVDIHDKRSSVLLTKQSSRDQKGMRILLADRDQTLCVPLEINGFIVEGVTDALDVHAYLAQLQFDAMLLVSPLPDASAAKLIRDIRQGGVTTPLLAIGNFDCLERIKLLSLGADDVISQDALTEEVIARLRAVIRRSAGQASNVVRVGQIELDIAARTVTVAGEPVRLTNGTFRVLQLLMLRKGMILTKENILSALYNDHDEPGVKIVDVLICKLRKALPPGTIETVWGRGFVMRDRAVANLGELTDLQYGGLSRDQLFDEVIVIENAPSLVPSL